MSAPLAFPCSGGHFYLSKPEESRQPFLEFMAADLAQLADAVVDGSATRTLDAIAAEAAGAREEGQQGQDAAIGQDAAVVTALEEGAPRVPPGHAAMQRGGSAAAEEANGKLDAGGEECDSATLAEPSCAACRSWRLWPFC